jgi:hypothetical protein
MKLIVVNIKNTKFNFKYYNVFSFLKVAQNPLKLFKMYLNASEVCIF